MSTEAETIEEKHDGAGVAVEKADSPEKTGRTYELQRKIDEELRKLQLEDRMDGEEETILQVADGPLADLKGTNAAYADSAEHIMIDDDKLDYTVDCSANHGDPQTVLLNNEGSATPPAATEIDTSGGNVNGRQEVEKVNGIYPLGPTEKETAPSNEETCERQSARSHSTNSDDSSEMTSPTTTAATYTLPPNSPGTEGDLNEVAFPVDQVPATFREHHLDGVGSSPSPQEMDVSEASSNVFFAHDQPVKSSPPIHTSDRTELASLLEQDLSDNHETAKQTENSFSTVENSEVNIEDAAARVEATDESILEKAHVAAIESEDAGQLVEDDVTNYDVKTVDDEAEVVLEGQKCVTPDEAVEAPEITRLVDYDDVTSDDVKDQNDDMDAPLEGKSETNEEALIVTMTPDPEPTADVIDGVTVTEANSEHGESPIEKQVESVPEESESISTFASALVQDIASSVSTDDVTRDRSDSISEDEQEVEIQNLQKTSETCDIPADLQSTQKETQDAAHTESFNRKVSTDEDEYSGFDVDVDVCDPLSYQDEISIAESEENTERVSVEPVRQACDEDNVPYFVDGQYTVQQVADMDCEPPQPDYDDNTPQIAPWDVVQGSSDISLSMGSTGPPVAPSTESNPRSDSNKSVSSVSSNAGEERVRQKVVVQIEAASSDSSDSSDEDEDYEGHHKIAVDMVDAAIHSAYAIASSEGVEGENALSDANSDLPEYTSTENEGANVTAAPNDNESNDRLAIETANEPNVIDISAIADDTIAEPQSDLPEAAQARERVDITQAAELIEEKESSSETTEVVIGSAAEAARIDAAELSHARDAEVKTSDSAPESTVATYTEDRSSASGSSNSDDEAKRHTTNVSEKIKSSGSEGGAENLTQDTTQGNTDSDTSSLEEKQQVEDQDIQTVHETEYTEEENQDEMVRGSEESPTKTRHFPERITYNPALSQRNTEATKWFGQPTAEDKIWMRPSGKVDENAEIERRKLIKAMTRRHNPHLVPKWQPPKEKDFRQDLSARQKASLEKYEARRKSRSEFGDFKIPPVQEDEVIEEPKSGPTTPTPTRENIIIESVVHSRDAISVWESRLNEKQQKEALERRRLSVGKQKKKRERANTDTVRERRDSSSSVSSNTSAVLPTSEHIERGSMNVSQVRNRWRNIEEESSKAKSPTHFKKETSDGVRSSSFSVNMGSTYRAYQRPSPSPAKSKVKKQEREHHAGPIIQPHKNESFIDKEIREAAEREERWKQEQWEKMSEVSAASSEEVFPDNIPTPSKDPKVVATIYTRSLPSEDLVGMDIMKDADREETWKEEHSHQGYGKKSTRSPSKESSGVESALSADIASPTYRSGSHVTTKEVDSESLSSYGSSITGNGIASPPPLSKIAHDQVDHAKPKSPSQRESPLTSPRQQDADSGIECNIVSTHAKTESAKAPSPVGPTVPNGGSVAYDKEKEEQRRQRIASLSSVVAPKGWEPNKTRTSTSISPVSPGHRSVPKPEVKSPKSPKATSEQTTDLLPISEPTITASDATIVSFVPPQFEEPPANLEISQNSSPRDETAKDHAKEDVTSSSEDDLAMTKLIGVLEEKVQTKNADVKAEHNHTLKPTEKKEPPSVQKQKPYVKPAEKKGGPQFTHKKTGPSFEVSSSKNRLETIMEREMREAMEREEEWKRQQIEKMQQGIDLSPHHHVHSTREIRTPTTAAPPPPVNVGEPVKERREVKSLFAEDSIINAPYIHEDTSDAHKKRTVVKAVRVPKRKSNMAMQWEKGNFQNNVPDDV